MSKEVSDCNTKHLVPYKISSKAVLNKLNGKYYKLSNDEKDYHVLRSRHDKHLIGKTIYARSAATCACGDKVCPRCIGLVAITNSDIAEGIAAFESEEITKVINQNILSTKHLLTTDSEDIEFNDDFNNFFTIFGGEISPIIGKSSIENIEDFKIWIDPEDISKINTMDYDTLFNCYINNGKFYVIAPDGEKIEISLKDEKEIYISKEAMDLMKIHKGYIPFSSLTDETKLFEIVIFNKELTRPLYMLMNIINKDKALEADEEDDNDTDETDTTNGMINTMCQKFLDLLIEGKIAANMVAGELIINRLIRSVARPYERPDFSEEELEPYMIYTVKKALERNKSPLIGISYANIKRQFLSDPLFEERDGESYIDPLYRTTVSTSSYRDYADIVHADDFED
jgi:hypothetical protein